MRFRPEQHLRRPADISAVRNAGRRVDGREFTLWWLRREGAEAGAAKPRVCVAASTAVVGPAVRRNRARRRLREVFRRHQDLVPAGCDLLLLARRSVNDRSLAELERAFVAACGRIGPRTVAP